MNKASDNSYLEELREEGLTLLQNDDVEEMKKFLQENPSWVADNTGSVKDSRNTYYGLTGSFVYEETNPLAYCKSLKMAKLLFDNDADAHVAGFEIMRMWE